MYPTCMFIVYYLIAFATPRLLRLVKAGSPIYGLDLEKGRSGVNVLKLLSKGGGFLDHRIG